MIKKMRIGELLIKLNLLTEAQLQEVLSLQSAAGPEEEDRRLGTILYKRGFLTKDQLIPVLEYQTGASYVDLINYNIDQSTAHLVSEKTARDFKLIPIGQKPGRLLVAMSDPLDMVARDDLKMITGLEPEVYLSFSDDIDRAINRIFTSSELAQQAIQEIAAQAEVEYEEERAQAQAEDTEDEVSRAPVVRLVNSILEQAVRVKASDIHIEPLEKSVKVRLRVDGELKEMMNMPKESQSALASRIKIMARLDIAEKRIPQDGRIEVKVLNRLIDLRVSVLPIVHGEKIVMRILDRSAISVTKQQLGFTSHNIQLFEKLIRAPEGIIMVCGPTGSGKTTTLYTVLKEVNKPNINIVTVEDPVEYRLEGVHQVQVNTKSGLTFAAGLRAILRQDPDVVMIGEIRDSETAEIATRAAITGHLVLSTIHTNDTVSTISRLVDMGIEVFMVASSLMGVIAQRLVKRVCTNCRAERDATPEELGMLGATEPVKLSYGKGCNACGGSGYAGRIAIHEVLVMDRELRSMVTRGEPVDDIKDIARKKKGLRTLNESCKELVYQGVTTIEEMIRVTYSVDD